MTFNRPEAHNAMTFAMYELLYEACAAVDADDEVRVMVLRGAGEKAFVAGTDIRQFADFDEPARTRSPTRRRSTASSAGSRRSPSRRWRSSTASRWAAASRCRRSATCASAPRPRSSGSRSRARSATACRWTNYARLEALLGPARVKDIIFTARTIEAEEALALGLATEVVEAERAEARVEELCELLASHAPVTLKVTKEALRRIRAATTPDGDDLVREAYGSEGFRRNVAAFLARSANRE